MAISLIWPNMLFCYFRLHNIRCIPSFQLLSCRPVSQTHVLAYDLAGVGVEDPRWILFNSWVVCYYEDFCLGRVEGDIDLEGMQRCRQGWWGHQAERTGETVYYLDPYPCTLKTGPEKVVYIEKRRGARTDPWVTPVVQGCDLTVYVQNTCEKRGKPAECRSSDAQVGEDRMVWWFTMSKAAKRSRRIRTCSLILPTIM